MTEEEFFRKNYPDSCYGDKPLSPHWDFFQDGVEFGERQSDKQIKELKESLEEWQKTCEAKSDTNSQLIEQLAVKNEQIEELQKDNEGCYRENEGLVRRFNELSEKNKELEAQLEQEKNLSQCRFDHNEQLRETVKKARNLIHRLLVLIQNHKWWNYTVINEARAFMSEVDRDKNNV